MKHSKRGNNGKEMARKRAFNLQNDQPKPMFGSNARDVSAHDELENKEENKFPLAPLSFLIPRASRASPPGDIDILGMLPLDPEVVFGVRSIAAAMTLVNSRRAKCASPKDDSSPTQSIFPEVNDSSYLPNSDICRQPTPPPELSEASTASPLLKPHLLGNDDRSRSRGRLPPS